MVLEAVDSSASSVPDSFVAEGRCCCSSAPVVAPCIDCLTIPVERTPGNLKAAAGGTTEAAVETTGMAVLGMPLADTDVDIEPATPGIGLEDHGTALADIGSDAPDIVLVVGTGIVDFSPLLALLH